jgi:peptide/nickel transport system substrate-binding protein
VKCTWELLLGTAPEKLRVNPRKSWYRNLDRVTTNGDYEVTFHLKRPQPAFLSLLAAGWSPVYPCHVSPREMRTKPIGTGPFKFAEFKQNESIKLVRNPDYWKPGKPYLDGIEYTIIPSRSTAILSLVSGKFDMTLTGELSPENAHDIQAQAPQMQCLVQTSNTQGNLLVNRDRPPFDDPRIRRAMVLSIDRKAFTDILSRGLDKVGGAMLPPPEGLWGWSKEFMETVPGYGADVEKSREEGRRIMKELGYGPDKMMPLKISTRNVASYRDSSVILIDHLKTVYIQGELEVLDSSVWYARLLRKDYAVGMNVQGTGIDDPDVMFFKNYTCGSERNYTGYCNPDLEKLYHQQSMMKDFEARRQLVWQIDKTLQEDGARPVVYQGQGGTCWWPAVKGLKLAVNSIYNHWRFEDVWLDR